MVRLRFAGRTMAQSLFLAMEKPDLTVAPAEANHSTRRLLREAKLPAKVIQAELVLQATHFVSQLAKQQAVRRWAAGAMRQDLLLPQAALREQRLQLAKGSPARRVPVRRCSRGPGPCALSRETLAARRCNRAARCDGFPTCARYRLPRNRRGLARCDNRCSRLRRTHAPPVRPFPIAAAGNDPPLLPLIAD
jgi:hypothetical protein